MCQSWFASKDVSLFTYNLRSKAFSEFGGGKDSKAANRPQFQRLVKYQLPCGEQSYEASTILGPGVVYSDDCYSVSRIELA